MALPADLARSGHFIFESGHHGDTWLELDLLMSQPKLVSSLAEDLAARLAGIPVEGHRAIVVDDAVNVGSATVY